jgi:outer membrane receptor protein involved in Fe transport
LNFRAECRYNDRLYANFDPAKRTNAADRSQPYRIPPAFVTDLHVDYSFRLLGMYAHLSVACNNVFNQYYIERGDDGATHDLHSFRGFWAAGCHLQAGIRVKW